MSGHHRERVHNTKHESRGVGEGVGGIGGRSEEGSERLGRAEIVGIKGKGEEKGNLIAIGVPSILSFHTTATTAGGGGSTQTALNNIPYMSLI